jgi:hypothetical protein
MTAYLQRLLDGGGPSLGIAPVPQSNSPVADADQRLLGSGPDDYSLPAAGADFADDGETGEAVQPAIPPVRRTTAPADAPQATGEDVPDRAGFPTRTARPPAPASEPPEAPEPVETDRRAVEPAPATKPEAAEAPRQAERIVPSQDLPPRPAAYDAPPAPARAAAPPEFTDFGDRGPDTPPEPRIDAEPRPSERTAPPEPAAILPQPFNPADRQGPEDHPPEREAVTPVEPALPEMPPPPPPPADQIVERQVERVVERDVARFDAAQETARDTPPTPVASPRTAASVSTIGPLPDRQRLRRINGLRWR